LSYARARAGFGAGLAALLLTGCAVMAPPQRPAAADAGFALEGRVAVRYGAESLSGRIAWTHLNARYSVRDSVRESARDEIGLASPLGNQLAHMVRDAGGVTLTDSNRQSFRAADAESLTEQRLGWRLPLTGLADWVQGRVSAGAAPEVQRDVAGRISFLAQSDWRIEYSYEDDAAPLPKRLIMQYVKSAEPLEIRLVIERWL
jgi:outer membrane lipoprotein LolB